MAIYYARKSGNINATDVWATTASGTAGAVTITSADTLMANSFTVTVNASTTALECRNDNANGATAGGSFALSVDGVTLTANVVAGSTGTVCASTSGSANVSVVGNISAGTSSSGGHGISHASTGTLSVTGAITGGAGSGCTGLVCNGGQVTITGSITGGANVNSPGVSVSSTSAVSISGTVTGGGNNASGGVVMTSGANAPVSFTGNCFGNSANSLGYGVSVQGGTLTMTGTATGGSAPGVFMNAGVATVTRAKGGPLAANGVGVACSAGSATVDEIEYGDSGASPTSGAIRVADKTSNVCLVLRPAGTKKTLVDTASTSLIPAASNVRSGITYNAGQSTGTCAVPGAASVLVGVAVDNTVGTAAVSSAAIQSACNSALTAFSSGRLANVATVDSTGSQIAAAVGQ